MGTHRIGRFVEGLKTIGADVAVVSYPVDVYYLAGTGQPSTLIIPIDGEPTLLVNRNIEVARQESWIRDVRESRSFKDLISHLTERSWDRAVIGICGDVLPSNSYAGIVESFPRARVVDVSMVLRKTRMVKDEVEISRILEAARISDIGHRAAREHLRPGVSESEVSTEIELEIIRSGGDGVVMVRNLCLMTRVAGVMSAASAYAPGGLAVTVSGVGTSPVLSHGPSKRILEKDDVVIVDLCGGFEGYLADQSRTYVLGKASREQERMANALKEIIERGLELLKPGSKASDIYAAVRQFAADAGYSDYLMGPKERNIRFIGHGVGLELDELPVLYPGDDTVLAEGMVIAFEPILMIPDVAVAVMENTVLITADGHQVLTKTPMEMVELQLQSRQHVDL